MPWARDPTRSFSWQVLVEPGVPEKGIVLLVDARGVGLGMLRHFKCKSKVGNMLGCRVGTIIISGSNVLSRCETHIVLCH